MLVSPSAAECIVRRSTTIWSPLRRQKRDAAISVRFGNVLASNGLVVPKFKAQIEAAARSRSPILDMVRYFMDIREACDLVAYAATHRLTPGAADCVGLCAQHGPTGQIVDLARANDPAVGCSPV